MNLKRSLSWWPWASSTSFLEVYILWEKLFWQVPWWWWRSVRSGIRKTDACWVIKRSSSTHSCYYYHKIFHIPPTGAVPLRKCRLSDICFCLFLGICTTIAVGEFCEGQQEHVLNEYCGRYQIVKCLKSLLLFILIMFKWQLPFPNCLGLFTNKILLGWDFVKVHAHNNCMLCLATNIQTPRISYTKDQNA